MRKLIFVVTLTLVCALPVSARAQGPKSEVQGFGGLTVGTSTFGSAVSSTFGGRVGVGLTPNIQVIGEAGRLADIKSPLFDLLDFTDIGVRVSAFYGEGGVRFIASPHSAVRPYGEATAGFARLNAGISGLGGPADAGCRHRRPHPGWTDLRRSGLSLQEDLHRQHPRVRVQRREGLPDQPGAHRSGIPVLGGGRHTGGP